MKVKRRGEDEMELGLTDKIALVTGEVKELGLPQHSNL